MSILTKEQLRGLIKENNVQSVPNIYNTLRELFKDILQEMLEAELATNL